MSSGDVPSEVVASLQSQPSSFLSSLVLTGQLSISSPISLYVATQVGLTPPVVAQMISSSAGATGFAGSKFLSKTPASTCKPSKVFCGITVNFPIFSSF